MIKGLILQEHITLLNVAALIALKQKLIELQRETDESTILVGDLNTRLIRNRSKSKKISKDVFELTAPLINWIHPTDNCRLQNTVLKLTWNISQDGPHFGL